MSTFINAYFGKSFMMIGHSLNHCFECKYCRANDNNILNYEILPSEINPLFKDIPVAINCFYGDPMLQPEYTIELLHKLEEAEHTGPVIIIIKGDLKKFVQYSGNYKFNLDLHFGLSTFGCDSVYNGTTMKQFESNMDIASTTGYNYSVEFRPIINEINDSDEVFRAVAKIAKRYDTGIGYCGLQMSDNLKERLVQENIIFKPYDKHQFGLKKHIGYNIDRNFRQICQDMSVPVFKKTSCLIAWKHQLERDPNAHYYRPNEVGCNECPLKEKCTQFKNNLSTEKLDIDIPFDYNIEEKTNHECGLFNLGICKFPSPDCKNINGKLIKIEEELTTTDVRIIKWLTGYTVDAKFIESPYCSEKWLNNN